MFLGILGGSYCNTESKRYSQIKTTQLLLLYKILIMLCCWTCLFGRTYMYSTKYDEHIDTWTDNVNEYSRTDLMQRNAIIIFVCVSVNTMLIPCP